jgi:hypothetical protein
MWNPELQRVSTPDVEVSFMEPAAQLAYRVSFSLLA